MKTKKTFREKLYTAAALLILITFIQSVAEKPRNNASAAADRRAYAIRECANIGKDMYPNKTMRELRALCSKKI